jgi:hypothetical protein
LTPVQIWFQFDSLIFELKSCLKSKKAVSTTHFPSRVAAPSAPMSCAIVGRPHALGRS